MPRLNRALPHYRLHRASGQAVVTLGGRDHYLGPFGSPQSRTLYDELIAQWLASGRKPPAPSAPPSAPLTVVGLVALYWEFAKGYYVKAGKPKVISIFIATTHEKRRRFIRLEKPAPIWVWLKLFD